MGHFWGDILARKLMVGDDAFALLPFTKESQRTQEERTSIQVNSTKGVKATVI